MNFEWFESVENQSKLINIWIDERIKSVEVVLK